MKRILYFGAFLIIAAIFMGFINPLPARMLNQAEPLSGFSADSIFPDSVSMVIERSCFDCHSDRSGNFAAKGKLNFTNWNEYTPAKKVSKMEAICEEITGGKMPKKSYISKNPDKALSQAEIGLICKWAADETKKLVGE